MCKFSAVSLRSYYKLRIRYYAMSILGGIAGIGASIFGGISASKAMRRVRNNICAV